MTAIAVIFLSMHTSTKIIKTLLFAIKTIFNYYFAD